MTTPDTSPMAKAAASNGRHGGTAPAADLPALVSIPEARRQLGGIGATAFYDAVKRHRIKLVRLGSRSLVPRAEIERVVAELMAAAVDRGEARARAIELAERSVAARRARRHST